MLQLIDQSLVKKFKINATDSGWGVLEGTFRPAVPREVKAYASKLTKAKDDDDYIRIQAEFYASMIKTWNIPQEVSAAAMQLLPIPIWDQLESTIMGFRSAEVVGNSDASSGS